VRARDLEELPNVDLRPGLGSLSMSTVAGASRSLCACAAGMHKRKREEGDDAVEDGSPPVGVAAAQDEEEEEGEDEARSRAGEGNVDDKVPLAACSVPPARGAIVAAVGAAVSFPHECPSPRLFPALPHALCCLHCLRVVVSLIMTHCLRVVVSVIMTQ